MRDPDSYEDGERVILHGWLYRTQPFGEILHLLPIRPATEEDVLMAMQDQLMREAKDHPELHPYAPLPHPIP